MKNIYFTLIFLAFSVFGFCQTPANFSFQDVNTNGTDFDAGIVFNGAGSGPVIVENSTIYILVDAGYTSASAVDIQGGLWTAQQVIDNGGLSGLCPGLEGTYQLYSITSNAQANVGAVLDGIREDLLTVTLNGPGDINVPVFPYDPTGGDPLSVCLSGLGVDNVVSIDPDGNAGTDPTTGYSNVPSGPAFSLPIELLSFTAKKLDDNSVGLRWTTSSEVNSSHFDIEKSKDGFFFEKIGEVRAAGNSNVPLDYNFTDDVNIFTQTAFTYYYRLKMVDLDGASEYSDIRSASFGGLGSPTLSVFPNPATTRLSISTGSNEEAIQIQMSDVDGRLVYKNTIPENTDLFDIYVDETSIVPGTYFMEFIQNNEVISTKKVIIMKY